MVRWWPEQTTQTYPNPPQHLRAELWGSLPGVLPSTRWHWNIYHFSIEFVLILLIIEQIPVIKSFLQSCYLGGSDHFIIILGFGFGQAFQPFVQPIQNFNNNVFQPFMQGVMHMIMGHDHGHKVRWRWGRGGDWLSHLQSFHFSSLMTEQSPHRPPGMTRCFPGTAGGIRTRGRASSASLTASFARTVSVGGSSLTLTNPTMTIHI